jgi:hypothetical protein
LVAYKNHLNMPISLSSFLYKWPCLKVHRSPLNSHFVRSALEKYKIIPLLVTLDSLFLIIRMKRSWISSNLLIIIISLLMLFIIFIPMMVFLISFMELDCWWTILCLFKVKLYKSMLSYAMFIKSILFLKKIIIFHLLIFKILIRLFLIKMNLKVLVLVNMLNRNCKIISII